MSDALRVGVVGAGAIAQVAHLPALARLRDLRVVGICDNDLSKAHAVASRFQIPTVYEDIEELLPEAQPEVVAICTPNHLHDVHVQAALSAGAHVLCERPLALSAAGVERIRAAVPTHGSFGELAAAAAPGWRGRDAGSRHLAHRPVALAHRLPHAARGQLGAQAAAVSRRGGGGGLRADRVRPGALHLRGRGPPLRGRSRAVLARRHVLQGLGQHSPAPDLPRAARLSGQRHAQWRRRAGGRVHHVVPVGMGALPGHGARGRAPAGSVGPGAAPPHARGGVSVRGPGPRRDLVRALVPFQLAAPGTGIWARW
ncbi:MAG: Gfo/Idh/MocA family oxidoreductase [Gemmatimonadetes bacterium]|nr:Gfo/Idh/MocA family oxidoreductase [Gemmatimonadota bacterium]